MSGERFIVVDGTEIVDDDHGRLVASAVDAEAATLIASALNGFGVLPTSGAT